MSVLLASGLARLTNGGRPAGAGGAGVRPAIVLGLAAMAGCAMLAVWPEETDLPPPSAGYGAPVLTFRPGAFLAKSPFDPRHRPDTATGSLLGPADPTAPPVAAPDVMVLGILVDGRVRKAMLVTDPTRWYGEGEEVDGWLIRRIEPETVTLTRGAEIRSLTYAASLSSLSR